MPTASQTITYVAGRAITILSGSPGYAKAGTASTGSTPTVTIKKNGSSVGTVLFNASATGAFTGGLEHRARRVATCCNSSRPERLRLNARRHRHHAHRDRVMSIAKVATSTGPNNDAASTTINLPTGFNSAGNITFVAVTQTGPGTLYAGPADAALRLDGDI